MFTLLLFNVVLCFICVCTALNEVRFFLLLPDFSWRIKVFLRIDNDTHRPLRSDQPMVTCVSLQARRW